MTIISSKEFVDNQKKYFDMAINEQVCIKRGKTMFQLIHTQVMEDDDKNDAELLALAISRRNTRDREFTNVDEFIDFLEK